MTRDHFIELLLPGAALQATSSMPRRARSPAFITRHARWTPHDKGRLQGRARPSAVDSRFDIDATLRLPRRLRDRPLRHYASRELDAHAELLDAMQGYHFRIIHEKHATMPKASDSCAISEMTTWRDFLYHISAYIGAFLPLAASHELLMLRYSIFHADRAGEH